MTEEDVWLAKEDVQLVVFVPITVASAQRRFLEWRHLLPRNQSGLFATALAVDDEIVAVAIAGNPARVWRGTGRIVISRVVVKPGVAVKISTCSRLYDALCDAAKALGYSEAWMYTLSKEPGTGLCASGFEEMGMTCGEEWSRPSRPRGAAVPADAKRCWRRVLLPPNS